MTEEEKLFHTIGEEISGSEKGQLFGKACFKINGKAFCCFFQNCMVFKLPTTDVAVALSLDGAKLFDPSGKSRPMKEWVQLPSLYKDHWKQYAETANKHISK